MNFKKLFGLFLLPVIVLVVLYSCDMDHDIYSKGFTYKMSYDLVSDFRTTDITPTSVTVSYICNIPIGMNYSSIGIEYRDYGTYSWKQSSGSRTGQAITVKLSNLSSSTEYEVRAFVRSDETYYGVETYTFNTASNAKLKLEDVVDNTSSSNARVYFTISSDASASEIGYCISEYHNPTITNRKEYRSNTKSFEDYSFVNKGKIYYARPYTKDSQGNIYYGDEVKFNTIAITNSLTVSDTKYQAKNVDGTYYYYHYTLDYSFSYYGDNLDKTGFHISNAVRESDMVGPTREWVTTKTGERTNTSSNMSINNPSPFEYYAYAKLKDGSYVYGIHKYCYVSF